MKRLLSWFNPGFAQLPPKPPPRGYQPSSGPRAPRPVGAELKPVKCPQCSGPMKGEARECPYCGTWFGVDLATGRDRTVRVERATSSTFPLYHAVTLGLLVIALAGCGSPTDPQPPPPPPSSTNPPPPTPSPSPTPIATPTPAPRAYLCGQESARGYQAVPNPIVDRDGNPLVEVHLSGAGLRSFGVGGDLLSAAAALGVREAREIPGVGFEGFMVRGEARAMSARVDVVAIHEIGVKTVDPILNRGVLNLAQAQEVIGTSGVWDRHNQPTLPLDGDDSRPLPLQVVHVYVLDTMWNCEGIDELVGRCAEGWSYSTAPSGRHGHGEAVASLIAGLTAGGAQTAVIHPWQVLSSEGMGRDSWVAQGLRTSLAHAQANGWAELAVWNLSLGGGISKLIDEAVGDVDAAGGWVVVAAGNSAPTDACDGSPARASCAWTIAAADERDSRAPFAQAGPCVDAFARGVACDSGISGWHSWAGSSCSAPCFTAAAVHARARGWSKAEFWLRFARGVISDRRGAPDAMVWLNPN